MRNKSKPLCALPRNAHRSVLAALRLGSGGRRFRLLALACFSAWHAAGCGNDSAFNAANAAGGSPSGGTPGTPVASGATASALGGNHSVGGAASSGLGGNGGPSSSGGSLATGSFGGILISLGGAAQIGGGGFDQGGSSSGGFPSSGGESSSPTGGRSAPGGTSSLGGSTSGSAGAGGTCVTKRWYKDEDFDEYGGVEFVDSCERPPIDVTNWVDVSGDCNDDDYLWHPNSLGSTRVPVNGSFDVNCDGVEDLADQLTPVSSCVSTGGTNCAGGGVTATSRQLPPGGNAYCGGAVASCYAVPGVGCFPQALAPAACR
ncbi:MAG: hypothetical protein SFV15_15455 [Polyangiaceae bacterium]|nr:hypothetical protein [Polyangiaceae bacterium]